MSSKDTKQIMVTSIAQNPVTQTSCAVIQKTENQSHHRRRVVGARLVLSNRNTTMASIKVTDKKGKFVGGAAARRKQGNKIQNPMAREKLKTAIGRHIHPQERMLASILRTMPRDILKSHNFPFYRDQVRTEMCERVQLPKLAPLKPKYRNMTEYNQIHASMVLEEARHIISESLFKRWGKDRIPPENGLELEFLSNEKMKSSDHLVYLFQAKRALTTEIKSKFRPGTVVELMPMGRHSVENIVLGNVIRHTPRGFIDSDDSDVDRQISIMIYNKSGEKFEGGVRVKALESLLNLTRQFDVCTNGNNDLAGEILGVRRTHIKFDERRSYIKFNESESEDESEDKEDHEVIEIEESDEEEIVKTEKNEVIEIEESDEEEIIKTEENEVTEIYNDDEERIVKTEENKEDFKEEEKDDTVVKKEETEKNEEAAKEEEKDDTVVKKEETEQNEEPVEEEEKDVTVVKKEENTDNCVKEEDNGGLSPLNDDKTDEGKSDPPRMDAAVFKPCKVEEKEEEKEDKVLAEFGYHVPNLNPTQKKAAKAFLDSTTERISIVQGPPGTGKTTLLVSVICHYLLRGKQSGKGKRLLVCAPTNKAVTVLATRVIDATRDDNYASTILIGDQERLLENNRELLRRYFVYTWRSAMVEDWERIARDLQGRINDRDGLVAWAQKRLNSIKRQVVGLIDDAVHSTMSKIAACLKGVLEAPDDGSASTSILVREITNLIKQLKSWDERQIVQTLLAEAHIIFCTLSSAGAQVMKETVAVDDIIVDEAAAATAPELAIGLWLVNHRLLLVGDPHQLPATVNSEYGKQNGLDKSLQDRLMNQCGFHYTMLDVQYRMKEEISQFPSKTFYDGNVTDGDNVLAFSYQPDASLLNSQPYAFVQVQGGEQRDSFGSCYNSAECDVVMGLLQELKNRSRHVGDDWSNVNRIRVITFYQAQVTEMRKRLHRHGLQNVLISTVDSSQGCEADVIIISFVRSEKIGFLSDYRRLNVALTRAKHQLVCVGDVKTLATLTGEKAKVVSTLAKDAIQRRCVVTDYTPVGQPLQSNGGQQRKNNKQGNHGRNGKPPARSQNGKRATPSQNGKRPTQSQNGKPPAQSQNGKPPARSHNGKPPTQSQNGKPPAQSQYGKPDANWNKRKIAINKNVEKGHKQNNYRKKVKHDD